MGRLLRTLFPGAQLDSADDIARLVTGLEALPSSEITPDPLPASQITPDPMPLPNLGTPAPLPPPTGISQHISMPAFRTPEGQFLPSPQGGYHYVGPSGSGQFANTLRFLVTKRNSTSDADNFRTAEFLHTPVIRTMDTELTSQHPVATVTAVDTPAPTQNPSLAWLKDHLPERDLADRLFAAFFQTVHPNMPLFHRGMFQVQYELLWSPGTAPAFGQTPHELSGWCTALLMVFILGAQALERDDLTNAVELQRAYLGLVMKDCLQRTCLTGAVSNVQTLLLLTIYLHNAGQRNTAWLLLGLAVRMAISLGMHRTGEGWQFNAIERNTRRMTWWTLHLFEQDFSFALGRPAMTSLLGVTTDLPDESFIDGGDHPPLVHAHAVALSDIAHRVKRLTAAISGGYTDTALLLDHASAAEVLGLEIQEWHARLPAHLQPTYQSPTPRHRRAVLLLHTYAQQVASILGRPYVLHRTNREIEAMQHPLDLRLQRLADDSTTAALAVLHHLLDLHQASLLDGDIWLDLYYYFHAMLLVCLPYIAHAPTDSPADITAHATVERIIAAVRTLKLAPTYRVLSDVAIGFARLVGLHTDTPPDIMPNTLSLPGELTIEQLLGLPSSSPTDPFSDLLQRQQDDLSIPASMMMLGGDFWGTETL